MKNEQLFNQSVDAIKKAYDEMKIYFGDLRASIVTFILGNASEKTGVDPMKWANLFLMANEDDSVHEYFAEDGCIITQTMFMGIYPVGFKTNTKDAKLVEAATKLIEASGYTKDELIRINRANFLAFDPTNGDHPAREEVIRSVYAVLDVLGGIHEADESIINAAKNKFQIPVVTAPEKNLDLFRKNADKIVRKSHVEGWDKNKIEDNPVSWILSEAAESTRVFTNRWANLFLTYLDGGRLEGRIAASADDDKIVAWRGSKSGGEFYLDDNAEVKRDALALINASGYSIDDLADIDFVFASRPDKLDAVNAALDALAKAHDLKDESIVNQYKEKLLKKETSY